MGIMWKPGAVILGEYLIEKELGRGGMGRVWLVKSKSTGRQFAVKQALLKEEKHRKAFLTELQTWIDLPEHPNIVPCRFFRTVGDEIVIFTDYIDGGSLADWIAKGKLNSLEKILDVAIQFAWGLHAIHERGLIHQDVKPGNVLMTEKGVPMVADFGLASARQFVPDNGFESSTHLIGQHSILVPGIGLMTTQYASPEQRAGQPLSSKTDIWSWGVSVLDIIIGGVSCPHGGHLADSVLKACLVEDSNYVYAKNIYSIIERALQRNAPHRWQSMKEASDCLISLYTNVCNRHYSHAYPIAAKKTSVLLFRRNDTGAMWDDPSQCVEYVKNIISEQRIDIGKPIYNQHNRREGFAITDLNRYLEMISQISSIASAEDADANYCLSEMHYNVALIYEELNDIDGAVSSYNSSLVYACRLTSCEFNPLYYKTTSALIYGQIALAERRRGQPAKAISYYNKSISIYASLIHNDPTNNEYLQGYAQVLSNAGIAYRYSGDIVKSLQCYDHAIGLYKQLASGKPDVASKLYIKLQAVLRMKGVALRKSNRDDEALKYYTEAQVILSKMEHARNDAEYLLEVIRLKEAMANVLPAEQRLQCFKYSVDTYKYIIEEYSGLCFHQEYAKALHSYADAFVRVGKVLQAIEQMKQSICMWQLAVNENGMTQHAGKLYYAKLYLAMLYLSLNEQSLAVRQLEDVRKESGMTMNEMIKHYEQYAATGGQDVFS